jgi:TRAP transporter TAXI family solute receptor
VSTIRTAALGLVLCALASCGGGESPLPARPLRIATGSPDGVYYAYGLGLAKAVDRHLPTLRARVLVTDASVENLRLVAADRADVAFALADAADDAVRGGGVFLKPLPLVVLARLYDNYVQVVVRASSPIRSLADLAGRRVSVGPPGSGTGLIADRILLLAGTHVRRRRLDIEASAAALAARRIDAFFWSGGLPTPAISALRGRVAVRLVSLGGVAARLRDSYDELYTETVVPRSVYGLASAVTTVSVPDYLVVRRDFDAETAYRLTRLLFRCPEIQRAHPEAARLDIRAAIATYPLDLHPGAARWYREAHR